MPSARKPKSSPAKRPSKQHSPTTKPPSPTGIPRGYSPLELTAVRDLFWHNIAREMLSGLSVLCQKQPEMFDGRFAVLTRAGERIPIGSISPLFAVSVPGKGPDHDASLAVQCTVFRIQTPGGEVFTLPVQEVRALHTLTPELIEELQKTAEGDDGEPGDSIARTAGERPFGLAAFTALPKLPTQAAPLHPTE